MFAFLISILQEKIPFLVLLEACISKYYQWASTVDYNHPKALAFSIFGRTTDGNKDIIIDLQGKRFSISCMSYMERKRPVALTQMFCFSFNFLLS